MNHEVSKDMAESGGEETRGEVIEAWQLPTPAGRVAYFMPVLLIMLVAWLLNEELGRITVALAAVSITGEAIRDNGKQQSAEPKNQNPAEGVCEIGIDKAKYLG